MRGGDPQPPWLLFVALSLGLHAAAALAIGHGRSPSPWEPTMSVLAGETLDVEPVPEPPEESPDMDDSKEPTASPPVLAPRAARPAHPAMPRTEPASEPNQESKAEPRPSRFGATDLSYATDLATTFTRAFPQAASADRAWLDAPLGSAGSADVTLTIDAEGQLVSCIVEGTPSSALRRGIDRTMSLLGSRSFTAAAMITRLHVSARVTADQVHDGLHGDVFALSGGSFVGDIGTAFFALPPSGRGQGRRVDVALRLAP